MLKSDRRLNEVLADRLHGSRTITRGILEVLENDLSTDPITESALAQLAGHITSRISSFALVFDLFHTIGSRAFAETGAVSAMEMKNHIREWQQTWHAAQHSLTQTGNTLLGNDATIITISSSGAVFDILRAAAQSGHSITVIGSVGLPGGEGRTFLEQTGRLGHRTELVDDPHLPAQVASADLMLVGSDAVFLDRFWNKTGTRELCAAAERVAIPVYVASETQKWAPDTWDMAIDPQPDPQSPGPLFEASPLHWPHLLCEQGIVTSGKITPTIAAKPIWQKLLTFRNNP